MEDKELLLISACLMGLNTNYKGKNNKLEGLDMLMEKYILVPACPEQLGGLPTPRSPSEIQEGGW